MANNILPKTKAKLFDLADSMISGLKRSQKDVGIWHNTDTAMLAALEAAQTACYVFDEARAARTERVEEQRLADIEGKKFIRVARGLLALRFGERYSADWKNAGFRDQSTAEPDSMVERQELLRGLHSYLSENPEREVPFYNLTAAEANVRFQACVKARNAVNRAIATSDKAKDEREKAMDALRKRMRGLINELTQLLDENENLWYVFGLNPPGAPETPEVPEDIEVINLRPGTVEARWTRPPRSDRFRVYKQIVGEDTELTFFATTYDPRVVFENLPRGKTLRLQIQAANDAGESGRSKMKEILVE